MVFSFKKNEKTVEVQKKSDKTKLLKLTFTENVGEELATVFSKETNKFTKSFTVTEDSGKYDLAKLKELAFGKLTDLEACKKADGNKTKEIKAKDKKSIDVTVKIS